MRKGMAAVLAAMVVIAAAPVGADTARQVTDDCGDAGHRVRVDDRTTTVDAGTAHVDLQAAGLEGVYAGDGALASLVASIELCNAASASDGGYGLSWVVEHVVVDDVQQKICSQGVNWTLRGRDDVEPLVETADPGQLATQPRAVLQEWCIEEGEAELRYRVNLAEDAAVFDGSTVRFTLDVADLPEAAAARLGEGATLGYLRAIAMDQRASVFGSGHGSDIPSFEYTIGTDVASGGDYTVGEDRPGS